MMEGKRKGKEGGCLKKCKRSEREALERKAKKGR
jgi:hypothetical protein